MDKTQKWRKLSSVFPSLARLLADVLSFSLLAAVRNTRMDDQIPPRRSTCAFCSRGLPHEGDCVTEGEAELRFGLRFTETGLLLQPPEPLGSDHRPIDPNRPRFQQVPRLPKRRPRTVT